jgi:hypothetical protein
MITCGELSMTNSGVSPADLKPTMHSVLTLTGSVSSAAWGTVCKRVLASVEQNVKAFRVAAPAGPEPVPVAVPSEKPSAKIQALEDVQHEELD